MKDSPLETNPRSQNAFRAKWGGQFVLAFKTTDLAGNSTQLGPPCCADEKRAQGPCERVAAPPREYVVPEPEPAGGCSLSPRSRANAAWVWLALVFGWVLRARSSRRLARRRLMPRAPNDDGLSGSGVSRPTC